MVCILVRGVGRNWWRGCSYFSSLPSSSLPLSSLPFPWHFPFPVPPLPLPLPREFGALYSCYRKPLVSIILNILKCMFYSRPTTVHHMYWKRPQLRGLCWHSYNPRPMPTPRALVNSEWYFCLLSCQRIFVFQHELVICFTLKMYSSV